MFRQKDVSQHIGILNELTLRNSHLQRFERERAIELENSC